MAEPRGIYSKARETWRRLTRTRYTRALEAENTFLRAENRALLNSILGIAGVPPISVMSIPQLAERGEAKPAQGSSSRRQRVSTPTPGAERAQTGRNNARAPRGSMLATPLRRRSWQQITRMLEFESARRNAEL
jgi:hypothetical protein